MILEKFRALGDETRLCIVKALFLGKKKVSEIVPYTGKSQPNVSIALKQLLYAGIIAKQKSGKFVIYSLKDPMKIKEVIRLLEDGS